VVLSKRLSIFAIVGVLFALLSGSSAYAQKTSPMFAVPNTGLEFKVPTSWKQTTSKKETRRETKFEIPLPNAGGTATLHVFSIEFRAEVERWNQAQRDIAGELHQEILEQRQEELLSVPLLLSKARTEGGVVLTGLVYTQAKYKLLFRLESSAAGAAEAEDQWRQAFLSLRTISGVAPAPDDPRKDITSKTAAFGVRPPPVTEIGSIGKKSIYKGPVVLLTKAALREVTVRFPKDWAFTPDGKDGYNLTGPQGADAVPAGLHLTVYSTLDSDPPVSAILKLSAASLDLFTKVASRDEKDGKKNAAGSLLTKVWRVGSNATGPLQTLEAAVAGGDFYVIVQAKFVGGLKKAQQLAIDELLDKMSVVGGA
jgi:hypothetical protein